MSQMKATLVDSMGGDLTTVNAARVSNNKHSILLDDPDKRLIGYLSREEHWSPFAHVIAQFRMKAPIFVARQLAKHQVGLTWNEISRRYVNTDIEFYKPEVWRKSAKSVKQGSSDEPSGWERWGSKVDKTMNSTQLALAEYEDAIACGVCMEQARMLLPLSMMTEWYWTGSLAAFARVVKQRTHKTAQRETKEVALLIKKALDEKENISNSWSALCL